MRPTHFLVGIFVFASAHATYWDEPVHDRGTVAIVQQTLRAQGYDPGPATDSAAAGGSDRVAQGGELRGSCDALIGPEKERCLKQGGTMETSAKSSR
jgi:hypothetical protein